MDAEEQAKIKRKVQAFEGGSAYERTRQTAWMRKEALKRAAASDAGSCAGMTASRRSTHAHACT